MLLRSHPIDPAVRLAPELVLEIMRHAGDIQDPFNPPPLDYDGHVRCHRTAILGQRSAIETRIALTRVSRLWNGMATPLLYEHISVSTRPAIASLLRVLTSSSLDGADVSLGRFVKRLDLLTMTWDAVSLQCAVQLCSLMPRLTTFIAHVDVTIDPTPLLDALSPDLRHLRWSRVDVRPEHSDLDILLSRVDEGQRWHPEDGQVLKVSDDVGFVWRAGLAVERFPQAPGRDVRDIMPYAIPTAQFVAFLDGHKRLTSLALPFPFISSPAVPPAVVASWRKKRWPSIREWILQDRTQASAATSYFANGAFAHMDSVKFQIDKWQLWEGPSTLIGDFISVHGGELTSVCFSEGEDLERYMNVFSRSLSAISLKACPKIREVHFALTNELQTQWTDCLARIGNSSVRMPHIDTIGIRVCQCFFESSFGRDWDFEHRMECLHRGVCMPWTKAFLNLTTIRVLDEVNFISYRKMDDVTRKSIVSPARWTRANIRVEDISGQFLAVFSKGISSLVEI